MAQTEQTIFCIRAYTKTGDDRNYTKYHAIPAGNADEATERLLVTLAKQNPIANYDVDPKDVKELNPPTRLPLADRLQILSEGMPVLA